MNDTGIHSSRPPCLLSLILIEASIINGDPASYFCWEWGTVENMVDTEDIVGRAVFVYCLVPR